MGTYPLPPLKLRKAGQPFRQTHRSAHILSKRQYVPACVAVSLGSTCSTTLQQNEKCTCKMHWPEHFLLNYLTCVSQILLRHVGSWSDMQVLGSASRPPSFLIQGLGMISSSQQLSLFPKVFPLFSSSCRASLFPHGDILAVVSIQLYYLGSFKEVVSFHIVGHFTVVLRLCYSYFRPTKCFLVY